MTKSKQSISVIIGLAVFAVAAVVGLIYLGGGSEARNELRPEGVYVDEVIDFAGLSEFEPGRRTNIYRADYRDGEGGGDDQLERWKYAIRDDDTCVGSVFSDGGRKIGDNVAIVYNNNEPVYVIYGSNEFNLADHTQHDGKYICFNVLLKDGRWVQGGTQLDLAIPDDNENGENTVPYMWDNYCLNEDSDWEASADEGAWCEEDDDRMPVAGRQDDSGLAAEAEAHIRVLNALYADASAAADEAVVAGCITQEVADTFDRINDEKGISAWLAIADWVSGSLNDQQLRDIHHANQAFGEITQRLLQHNLQPCLDS